MLAADGTPLKTSLNRALRKQKRRALMLIAPLLIFIVVTFIYPIGEMLFRSVENQIVGDTLPRTVRGKYNLQLITRDLPALTCLCAALTSGSASTASTLTALN